VPRPHETDTERRERHEERGSIVTARRDLRRAAAGAAAAGIALVLVAATAAPGGAETFRDWELTCTDIPTTIAPGTDPSSPRAAAESVCYTYSATRNQNDNTVLAAVGVRLLGPEKTPTLMFQLIPGIDRQAGLRFAVDNGPTLEGDVRGCDEEKCIVLGQLTADLVQAMKAGSKMYLTFRLNGEDVPLEISLRGFTRSLAELQARQR
jgi:invasion protein IalB